jgi:hypothetical protein
MHFCKSKSAGSMPALSYAFSAMAGSEQRLPMRGRKSWPACWTVSIL